MKFFSKKRKILRRNKFLLGIFIIILLVFGLNCFQKEVKTFFYSISSPIQKSLWKIGDRTSNFLEEVIEMKETKNKVDELCLKNQRLLAEIAILSELKKENKVLREALGINLGQDFKLTLAEIIGKDISQDFILINKGSKDNISENMPVITQQKVLLGKVSEVYENFSKVMLISNKGCSFDVKIQEKDIAGVVKGKGNFKVLLDFVPQNEEISQGDIIVSSSLGGLFPAGLLVGQIEEVKKSDIEFFQQAKIKPIFDIKEINFLFVITEY